jgi:hypothetical protein
MSASTSKSSSSTDQIRTLLKKEVERETKDLSIADTIVFAGQTQATEEGAEGVASGIGRVYDKLLMEVISEVLIEKARRVVSIALS